MASSRSLVARRHTKDEAPSVIVALEGRSYLWSRLGELMEHPRACAHDPPTNTQAWARGRGRGRGRGRTYAGGGCRWRRACTCTCAWGGVGGMLDNTALRFGCSTVSSSAPAFHAELRLYVLLPSLGERSFLLSLLSFFLILFFFTRPTLSTLLQRCSTTWIIIRRIRCKDL